MTSLHIWAGTFRYRSPQNPRSSRSRPVYVSRGIPIATAGVSPWPGTKLLPPRSSSAIPLQNGSTRSQGEPDGEDDDESIWPGSQDGTSIIAQVGVKVGPFVVTTGHIWFPRLPTRRVAMPTHALLTGTVGSIDRSPMLTQGFMDFTYSLIDSDFLSFRSFVSPDPRHFRNHCVVIL